jgi:predicted RNase H-like HicB family nuclease
VHHSYDPECNASPGDRLTRTARCDIILIGVRALKPHNLHIRQLALPIVFESDADGYFVSCPALQGCYSQGDTYEEALANIKDAIRLHIEDRVADGKEIPEHVSVGVSKVEVSM